MIQPLQSLAFAIQSSKGVYALLLGSGISRTARVPTGWEVTIDLIRRLAQLERADCGEEPEVWYRQRFGSGADYSVLLDSLASAPAGRQALLRAYFERLPDEEDQNVKRPTSAHRAIAVLVARGFIKVIVTTNFDRLLEMALADEGVIPTIISSDDAIIGALPLAHSRCCIIKLHGDYLDTRIKNTAEELSTYSAPLNKLLDQVLDEYGVVVCGWSASWDSALRAALTRAPSRRFSMYWAHTGPLGDEAQSLVLHRQSQLISISGADDFFVKLKEYVLSLEAYGTPHPLSIEIAVVSMKRYLAEERYRIQLHDLVRDVTADAVGRCSSESVRSVRMTAPTTDSASKHARVLESATSTIVAIGFLGGAWFEKSHAGNWSLAINQLGKQTMNGGSCIWVGLEFYPATLLLYAIGLGALESGRVECVSAILCAKVAVLFGLEQFAVQKLPPSMLFDGDQAHAQILEGMSTKRYAMSEWLRNALREPAKRVIVDDGRYDYLFDFFEMLIALAYAQVSKEKSPSQYWVPTSHYVHRLDSRRRVFAEIRASILAHASRSPFVVAGVFGRDAAELEANLIALEGFSRQVANQSW